jgi:hypothetical protein
MSIEAIVPICKYWEGLNRGSFVMNEVIHAYKRNTAKAGWTGRVGKKWSEPFIRLSDTLK